MELPTRKSSKRAIEPVDEWLQNEGYYRKHAPKDPTCLFRAISEQVYHNQRYHIRVRKECIEFMRKNKLMFEDKISVPFDSYLEQMSCFTEWGGMNEILAVSLLFKRNIVIFHGQKLIKETVIDYGHKESINLCFTPLKQYESVYTQEYTANAGFCQALVYQTLYKNVFKMNNVDATVHKMLHERNNHLRHDKFFLKGNLDIRNQLTLELLDKFEENNDNEEFNLLSKGITPFPYRVAKALDPNIYRNVDYDIWHEIRKEVRNSGYTKFNSSELQTGAKCLVQIDLKDNDKANNNFLSARENWDNNSKALTKSKRLETLFYTGHIQEMRKNEGPVVVFIVELGEKMTVPYEALKPFPQRKIKQNNWAIASNKKNLITQNGKWRKPWNSSSRKPKEQIVSENNDKNQASQKAMTKNVIKSEWSTETTMDNHSLKLQAESYTSYKEYSVNSAVDNMRTVLENTHISSVETVEQVVVDKTKDNSDAPSHDNSTKKHAVVNVNPDVNRPNKQQNHRTEKTEVFYPPYPNSPYPPTPRFFGDQEMVNYDVIKNAESNDVPYSDPATVRHFYNLGVKYFWSQNMWTNGTNGSSYSDNAYYIAQPPPEFNTNVNDTVSTNENINTSNRVHRNNRSPPRLTDQENFNGSKANGQKPNYRGFEFRNSSTSRDSHQASNVDVNRNRIDYKNSNSNDQQPISNNKETQRVNKTNGMAPRFKRNYEGKNRNDQQNGQQHYRQHQYHHDYDYHNNAKQLEPVQMIPNHCEMNEVAQLQHQQNAMQSQQHLQQPPPPILQPQNSPPLNNSYSYSVPYNQQVPFVPVPPYPAESESFSGHFYPPPAGFIQVPYMPPAELNENNNAPNGPCTIPPIYPAMENFSGQYPTMYSQYVYHPPAIYPNQPSTAAVPENCYPPFPAQPYFIPYPPPNVNTANPPNPQNALTH